MFSDAERASRIAAIKRCEVLVGQAIDALRELDHGYGSRAAGQAADALSTLARGASLAIRAELLAEDTAHRTIERLAGAFGIRIDRSGADVD